MPAAGSGERLGLALPKALVEIGGRPMFAHAVLPFAQHDKCVEIVVAAPKSHLAAFQLAVENHLSNAPVFVVAGGESRQDSVSISLNSLRLTTDFVLVHDAARPLVTLSLINRVLEPLEAGAIAVVPGLPLSDTVKEFDSSTNRVIRTVPRETLLAAQTPQGVKTDVLRAVHRLADEQHVNLTDDAALIEYFSYGEVILVPGEASNFKVTNGADLEQARVLLSAAKPDR